MFFNHYTTIFHQTSMRRCSKGQETQSRTNFHFQFQVGRDAPTSKSVKLVFFIHQKIAWGHFCWVTNSNLLYTLLLRKKLSNINSWSETNIKIWNNIINGLWKTKKMATSTLKLKDILGFRYEHILKCKNSQN